MTDIIEQIKSRIAEKGLKLKDIYIHAGISKATLWRILNYKVDPKISTLNKIQDYLDSII